MTTITNFIECNFQGGTENELPIWVILSHKHYHKIALINQILLTKKPLLHLDLGIRSLRNTVQPFPSYTLITPSTKQKIRKDFTLTVGKNEQKALLIQGLEAYLALTSFEHTLQQFISRLPSTRVKQIIIFGSSRLPLNVQFALQRISTCLTTTMDAPSETTPLKEIVCKSIVRRSSGYSKEELYVIEMGAKVHVRKWKKEEVKSSSEMSLNFKAQKGSNIDEVKHMIYPHLKVKTEGKPCGCKHTCDCHALIVLDEEQEDDDDVDV